MLCIRPFNSIVGVESTVGVPALFLAHVWQIGVVSFAFTLTCLHIEVLLLRLHHLLVVLLVKVHLCIVLHIACLELLLLIHFLVIVYIYVPSCCL